MFRLIVHGGAGTIAPERITEERRKQAVEGLRSALKAGFQVLTRGGPADRAVEEAVATLEDDPFFNAGRGAVLNHAGDVELDAALMLGSTRSCGAVGAVRSVRNPIRLARAVLERTDHVMLVGAGADALATELGLQQENQTYFKTEDRTEQWHRALGTGTISRDHDDGDPSGRSPSRPGPEAQADVKRTGTEAPEAPPPRSKERGVETGTETGTVGAVAIDADGRPAAATSSGGVTNKRPGRIGDTPIPGAGTYASDLCAISCTGRGEAFMVPPAAFAVEALARRDGLTIPDAAIRFVSEHLEPRAGGLIAIGNDGSAALPFNSRGMYRGIVDDQGRIQVGIWRHMQPAAPA